VSIIKEERAMAFQLSPGVVVTEKDFTSIVPNVATSAGAFVGKFEWGPIEDPVQITSENEVVERFGKPNDSNFESFFTAANFLSYSNNLFVVRGNGSSDRNAVVSGVAVKIKNAEQYLNSFEDGQANVGEFAAKWAGSLGNSLKVSMADKSTYTGWTYESLFDRSPDTSAWATSNNVSNDELHVVVIDEDGQFTGSAGTILEKFEFISKAYGAKKSDGSSNFYKEVINSNSRYIWWMDHPNVSAEVNNTANANAVNWGTVPAGQPYKDITSVLNASLTGGVDDYAVSAGNIQTGYALFANDQLDISLVLLGKATTATAIYVINNIVEARKDAVAFISPEAANGSYISDASATPVADIIAYRNALPSSSYGILDSGYKFQYDRYNDKYRYVPLNGDTAGLAARTDYAQDPWYSPAGSNRGQIKNVVKLAFNPNRAQRDSLYQKGINPIVTFPGEGTQLFGDKTLLAAPSAFDRINVRRLFIVLEKSISIAAKAQLFEFNDAFTRAQFKNQIEPFLRDVQGRRGITDFRVVCDETNNTADVIDKNEFVASIFIKPNRSINFINLTFVAARSSVNFSEIGG
jgi:phage tail sheath protein FI